MSIEGPLSELTLVKGSSTSFEIALVDENGNPESVADVDRVVVTIKDRIGSGAVTILERSSAAGNASVSAPDAVIVCTMSQAEADALSLGVYVAEVAVRFSPSSKWFHSDLLRVRVRASIAPHLV